MSRVNIIVQFKIRSLTDDYYLVGTSDISSFTHKLGSGADLYTGDPANLPNGWEDAGVDVKRVVPLGENYGDFRIRFYAQNSLGIRSPYVEVGQLIPAPDISGTFRFKDVRVRHLLNQKPSAFRAVTKVATAASNEYKCCLLYTSPSPRD